ncbi:MAG: hypothetical protein WCD53_23395 [Microcoleus sp.]
MPQFIGECEEVAISIVDGFCGIIERVFDADLAVEIVVGVFDGVVEGIGNFSLIAGFVVSVGSSVEFGVGDCFLAI